MLRVRDTPYRRAFAQRDRGVAYRGGFTPSTPIEASKDLGACVYFARTRDGLIKIGFTTQMHIRRHGLAIEWGDILAVMPGTLAHEKACHTLHAAHLARGREYFHPHPDLMAHINEIREHLNVPLLEEGIGNGSHG